MPVPNEGDEPDPPDHDPRKAAIAAVVLLIILLIAGLALTHRLKSASDIQDCLMAGGKRCDSSISP